jgi:hypothetical protein
MKTKHVSAYFIVVAILSLAILGCKKKKDDPQPDPNANATTTTGSNAQACIPISGFKDVQWQEVSNPIPGEKLIFKSNGDYWVNSSVYGTWSLKGCDTLFVITNSPQFKFFYKVLSKNDTTMKVFWKNVLDTTRYWRTYKKMPF